MSERKVNLKDILISELSANLQNKGASAEAANSVARTSVKGDAYYYVLKAMKEACRQTLKLAAENVTCTEEHQYDEYDYDFLICKIDRQSILDTINQVE